jgi:hypothetical protein
MLCNFKGLLVKYALRNIKRGVIVMVAKKVRDRTRAFRLKDRFVGQEVEILRTVRIHGLISSMSRYNVADFICWKRYIDEIKKEYSDLTFADYSSTDDNKLSVNLTSGNNDIVVSIPKADNPSIDKEFLGYCADRKQLANEFVNAFSDKLVALKSENDRLRIENDALKEKLAYLEDKEDDSLCIHMVNAIEVMKRC